MGDFFQKIVITKDAPAPYYSNEGILVKNIYDFLPNPDSLEVCSKMSGKASLIHVVYTLTEIQVL